MNMIKLQCGFISEKVMTGTLQISNAYLLAGHEDGGVPSGGGGDPAVLAVGPSRRALTYTRDELMRLRHSPLVKKGLEDAFAGCEALAL